MGLLEKGYKLLTEKIKESEKDIKTQLITFLLELKKLEAKLWGITITDLHSTEEKILEDVNHLIYLLSQNQHTKLKKILQTKDWNQFQKDLINLREDFKNLKKKITQKNKLKNLITEYTIKQVNHSNYHEFEKIFILEKQLYTVLEHQEKEFENLFKTLPKLKSTTFKKEDTIQNYIKILKEIRKILSGHIDFHHLWEEERKGYSNISNILHSLIKTIQSIEEK